MSNERDGINFNLLTLKRFDDRKLAELVIEKLVKELSFLAPTKYGTYSPLKGKVSKKDLSPIIEAWFSAQDSVSPFCAVGERILCLEQGRGEINLMINWSEDPASFNSLSGSFPSQLLASSEQLEEFLNWIEELTSLVDPAYGFIQNMMTKGWATPYDLKLRLPEVPWGSIFGTPYIKMFGKDKLLSSPCANVKELASGHVLCQLTEDLLNPDLPVEKRTSVRTHLGSESFMEGRRQPRHYKNGQAPSF